LNEVEDASILKTGPDARYRRSLLWLPRAPVSPRAAGYRAAISCIGPLQIPRSPAPASAIGASSATT